MAKNPTKILSNQEGKTLNPEAVARSREGILKAAGSWKNVNTKAFTAYINNRRRTAPRS
jgi:hypothetical protein